MSNEIKLHRNRKMELVYMCRQWDHYKHITENRSYLKAHVVKCLSRTGSTSDKQVAYNALHNYYIHLMDMIVRAANAVDPTGEFKVFEDATNKNYRLECTKDKHSQKMKEFYWSLDKLLIANM